MAGLTSVDLSLFHNVRLIVNAPESTYESTLPHSILCAQFKTYNNTVNMLMMGSDRWYGCQTLYILALSQVIYILHLCGVSGVLWADAAGLACCHCLGLVG